MAEKYQSMKTSVKKKHQINNV